jgi:hypothetical protein
MDKFMIVLLVLCVLGAIALSVGGGWGVTQLGTSSSGWLIGILIALAVISAAVFISGRGKDRRGRERNSTR